MKCTKDLHKCLIFLFILICAVNVYGMTDTEKELLMSYEEEALEDEYDEVSADYGESAESMEDIMTETMQYSMDLYFNGSGTADNPYEISNRMDLTNLSNLVTMGMETNGIYFIIINDIYLNGQFYPIGTAENPFQGHFFSDTEVSVYNLNIDSYTDYGALFAYTKGARIENINLEDVSIKGKNYAAGFIANGEDTEIINSSVSGIISGEYGVGGIIANGVNIVIKNCASLAEINGNALAGGLVSSLTGSSSTINDSLYYGSIILNNSNDKATAGGFAGYMDGGRIERCFAYGDIRSLAGESEIGSFIYKMDSGFIKDSYGAGTVNADSASGFVYQADAGEIQQCYSTVRISGNDYYAPFAALNSSSAEFKECYYNGEINQGYVSDVEILGVNYLTTSQMTDEASTYMIGLDEGIWYFDQNNSEAKYYPFLNSIHNGKYSSYSLKSGEAGTYYSVKFIIPFDMEAENPQLLTQLVEPNGSCIPPILKGANAQAHLGWSESEEGEVQYGRHIIENIGTNLVLYPVFSSKDVFKIVYTSMNASSGTAPLDEKEYSKGDTAVIKSNEGNLVRTGYEFNGWQDQNQKVYTGGETVTIAESLKLNPVWKAEETKSNNSDTTRYYYSTYDNTDYSGSLSSFLELFKAMGELYSVPQDNKIILDSEAYYKETKGIFEDSYEVHLKFSLELPLDAVK